MSTNGNGTGLEHIGSDAQVSGRAIDHDYLTRPNTPPNGTGKVDYDRLQKIGYELLEALGENPERDGLLDTPRRFASMWRDFIEHDPGKTGTTFERVTLDQLVVVRGMKVWSFCEHHLLPFWCRITVGYIPNTTVLGLSKFARIAEQYAHRLQLQERLVNDIANHIHTVTGTNNVAVYGVGEHLCMTMRGVESPANMVSSVLNGAFRDNPQLRQEFMSVALAPQIYH